MKFNVFRKNIKNSKGKEFPVYFTKNDNGVSFRVHFVSDCENANLIPKTNEPFVLVADTKHISQSIKRVNLEGEKVVTKLNLYIRKIDGIETYEEPEFSAKDFNSIDKDIYDVNTELQF